MSRQFNPHFIDPKGILIRDFARNGLIAAGTTKPTDATVGYATGCLFMDVDAAAGLQLYVNEGTATSCLFKPLSPVATALGVAGVAAGYKIARGQDAVTGTLTKVTGLALVVSAVANLEDDPVVDPEMATATIGNQSGAPAAGSIVLKTWKTFGGTPAAGTVAKNVNWIAIGT